MRRGRFRFRSRRSMLRNIRRSCWGPYRWISRFPTAIGRQAKRFRTTFRPGRVFPFTKAAIRTLIDWLPTLLRYRWRIISLISGFGGVNLAYWMTEADRDWLGYVMPAQFPLWKELRDSTISGFLSTSCASSTGRGGLTKRPSGNYTNFLHGASKTACMRFSTCTRRLPVKARTVTGKRSCTTLPIPNFAPISCMFGGNLRRNSRATIRSAWPSNC